MVTQVYDTSTWEAKARDVASLDDAISSGPAWATETDLVSRDHKRKSKNCVRLRTKQDPAIGKERFRASHVAWSPQVSSTSFVKSGQQGTGKLLGG